MTRGIRNNNPLNIRYSKTNWNGKVLKENKKDPNFEEFTSMYFGFRAALINIETYIIKYGCNTITKIIHRWAPPTDGNNTASYIQHVCRITNTGGNEPISNHSRKLRDIVAAMAFIESGHNITAYYDALDRAFDDFKPKSVYHKERTCHYAT